MTQPWHFACMGKERATDRPGSQLHVWKMQPDKTAICLKCDTPLTKEQALDCFFDRGR